MSTNTVLFPMLLHEVASNWRNLLNKRLQPLGLSQAKWRTLIHLSVAKETLTQTELANRMGIEGPTLVGLLDRLAKDGWIIRQDAQQDRRSKTVHLTKKAQKVLTQIWKQADALRDELLTDISEQELQACIQIFQRIQGRVEAIK